MPTDSEDTGHALDWNTPVGPECTDVTPEPVPTVPEPDELIDFGPAPTPEPEPVAEPETPPQLHTVMTATTLRTEASPMLEAATLQARDGVCVFPCGPNKNPLTLHGFKDASTDEAEIRDWWIRWPDAGIGIPTGKVNGFIVLDVDMDKLKGVDGEAALQALLTREGAVIPTTRTVRTPRGGRHLYFKHPGRTVKNSTEKIGPGLDIRGDDGYVITPPSRTGNGQDYKFEVEGPIAELPSWLENLIVEPIRNPATTPARRLDDTPDRAKVEDALRRISANCSFNDWLHIGMALHSWNPSEGRGIWDSWSQTAPERYKEPDIDRHWKTFKDKPGGITIASLFDMAIDKGWKPRQDREGFPITEDVKPWRMVTADDVRKAISHTGLEPLVRCLEAVTEPPLPLEITLPQALALAGCALSQPVDSYDPEDQEASERGVNLARLVVNTAGGQVCNIWALIVAESGAGKDIGNADNLAAHFDWHAGTSGSAEGLADGFREHGAGLLSISEFAPFLMPRHWQYTASHFLTAAFNKGHFRVNLSQRRGGPREARYCYPNIIANIQPEALLEYATRLSIDTGFLPRFLISRVVEPPKWRPTTKSADLFPATEALNYYSQLQGKVIAPERYLNDVFDEFFEHNATLGSHWRRLVNEYGPRIAVMLAGNTVIQDRQWEHAGIILRWFYSMAETVLLDVEQDAETRRMNNRLQSITAYIKKESPCKWSDFVRRFSRQIPLAEDRERFVRELVVRKTVKRYREDRVQYLSYDESGEL